MYGKFTATSSPRATRLRWHDDCLRNVTTMKERLITILNHMATFTQVKAILDSLIAGRDPARVKDKHGGGAFAWGKRPRYFGMLL